MMEEISASIPEYHAWMQPNDTSFACVPCTIVFKADLLVPLL